VRKPDLLAELTDVLPDGVSQDLWILSVGIDNNPSGQYQPLQKAVYLLYSISKEYNLEIATKRRRYLVSLGQITRVQKLL